MYDDTISCILCGNPSFDLSTSECDVCGHREETYEDWVAALDLAQSQDEEALA